MIKILVGDCRDKLKELPDGSVQCCVTSPPYFGLRDYGEDDQIGLEELHDCLGWATGNECGCCFVCQMVNVFREVKRVLRDDGTVFLNLGDSYAGSGKGVMGDGPIVGGEKQRTSKGTMQGAIKKTAVGNGLKEKDLMGIPWRVALALQADGWYLRSDVIWCLSGGTVVYARTQKGDMPMTIKDLARLDPATVKLWNGEKWTQLLGMSKSHRIGTELEIVLRSGERISCTPTHQFPTRRGLLTAVELIPGDLLCQTRLPEPTNIKDSNHIGLDAAWFAGLYIAEGSRSGGTIQISGHVKEQERWARVKQIAESYGGTATRTIDGNNMNIRVYGKLICAIVDELVSGHVAKNKCFSPVCWRYSDAFLNELLKGYLSGDGHYDAPNDRWRLGFTRNYNLERDLRVLCARLGYRLRVAMSTVRYDGRDVPTFRGEIRFQESNHHNVKSMMEVIEIRKARCREVYDLGVEDEPHVFALASGVLTHNSKPSPMPESVTDRVTKAHEYLFMLAKRPQYFFDNEAIKEPLSDATHERSRYRWQRTQNGGGSKESMNGYDYDSQDFGDIHVNSSGRNRRSVWTIPTAQFKKAHFAVFPTALVEPCIKAGTSEHGACPECGAPYRRVVEKSEPEPAPRNPNAVLPYTANGMANNGNGATTLHMVRETKTTDWRPSCKCEAGDPVPCVVLDPFSGAGTSLLVSDRLGRDAIGIELNPEYALMSKKRIESECPLFAKVALTSYDKTGTDK